jgi:hypothetical protein
MAKREAVLEGTERDHLISAYNIVCRDIFMFDYLQILRV